MSADESTKSFSRRAAETLEAIEDRLADWSDQLDAELAGDVMTLEFTDGTKYILNSHSAAQQIWFAAGTQAWHFDWLEDQQHWFAAKTQEELRACVKAAVAAKLGQAPEL